MSLNKLIKLILRIPRVQLIPIIPLMNLMISTKPAKLTTKKGDPRITVS